MAKERVSPRPARCISTAVRYAHIATLKRRQDLARLLEGPGEGS